MILSVLPTLLDLRSHRGRSILGRKGLCAWWHGDPATPWGGRLDGHGLGQIGLQEARGVHCQPSHPHLGALIGKRSDGRPHEQATCERPQGSGGNPAPHGPRCRVRLRPAISVVYQSARVSLGLLLGWPGTMALLLRGPFRPSVLRGRIRIHHGCRQVPSRPGIVRGRHPKSLAEFPCCGYRQIPKCGLAIRKSAA